MRTRRPQLRDLRSVKQLCDDYPDLFTEGSLRWLIWNADSNGFAPCVIRTGRRVLLDVEAMRRWLDENREAQLPADPPRMVGPQRRP